MQLYLNNSGDRWVETDKEYNRVVVVYPDGTRKVQQAVRYESFGNFALTVYRVKKRIYKAFAVAYDGSDTRDPEALGVDALPHVFHKG